MIPVVSRQTRTKLRRLQEIVGAMESAVVAFSGGVDSTFLTAVAHEALGGRVLAVTGVSASVPAAEVAEAQELARCIGVRHELLATEELDNPAYVANAPDRCFHCKTELYGRLARLAAERGYCYVLDGTNADDLGDQRPGRAAAVQHGVRSPLVEASLGKEEIRALSRERHLPTWDKPALACLASRIPHGAPVTVEVLEQVGAAEALLRELGVRQLRVRHHGPVARIESDAAGMALLFERRDEVVRQLRALGYRHVALDLAGYRQGSLNAPPP